MSNKLYAQWPLSLHASVVIEKKSPLSAEVQRLCKRLPSIFTQEGPLTAFTFALSREQGDVYCELLRAMLTRREVSSAKTDRDLIQELMKATPERYRQLDRELQRSAQALRDASSAMELTSSTPSQTSKEAR